MTPHGSTHGRVLHLSHFTWLAWSIRMKGRTVESEGVIGSQNHGQKRKDRREARGKLR